MKIAAKPASQVLAWTSDTFENPVQFLNWQSFKSFGYLGEFFGS